MFSFFSKKKELLQPILENIKVDIHSHLLPGIDDGSKNIEDSIFLIKNLIDLGYQKIVTTPHVMHEVYPNTSEIIIEKLETVKKALAQSNINIDISAAAEYYIDGAFLSSLKEQKLLTLFDNYVLVEMSFMFPLSGLFDHFFQIERQGYNIILAHPERYTYYHHDYNVYAEIKEQGVQLQLNLLSLTGYYGESTKKVAIKLLKDKLIDFVGTDTHHERHIQFLKKMTQDKALCKMLCDYEFSNQFITK